MTLCFRRFHPLVPALWIALPSLAGDAGRIAVTSAADAGPGSLRAAIEVLNASGSGVVDLRSVPGTIRLESALPEVRRNLSFEGPDAGLTLLDGQGRWPLLAFAAGTTSEVTRLIFTNGLAAVGQAGGAVSNAGTLVLRQCEFAGNRSQSGRGGALYNAGELVLHDCRFRDNTAAGPSLTEGGGAGLGGAVHHAIGSLHATNCVFEANRAVGGDGAPAAGSSSQGGANGGPGGGGALFAQAGQVTLAACTFLGNRALGGNGSDGIVAGGGGGIGHGGACLSSAASFTSEACRFETNSAAGGSGGGATGISIGSGGTGGGADGGAVALLGGDFHLSRCLTIGNTVGGGSAGSSRSGPVASFGRGGGLSVSGGSGDIVASAWVGNGAEGGAAGGWRFPGAAGPAAGGGIWCGGGVIRLENCTISRNTAHGANGAPPFPFYDPPPAGESRGGGLAAQGSEVFLRFCTVAENQAVQASIRNLFFGDVPAGFVSGGGLFNGGGVLHLEGVLCANNRSATNADLGGTVQSLRVNLVGRPGNATGLSPGDLVGVEPLLGPLDNHGGPTPTHPLLFGSPALDVLADNGPVTDQRGVARPGRAGVDLGAYELVPTPDTPPRIVSVRRDAAGQLEFQIGAPVGVAYDVESSEDLATWTAHGTAVDGQVLRENLERRTAAFRLKRRE